MSLPHKTASDNSGKTSLTCKLGDWNLSFRPEIGGSLDACTWKGHDILRNTVHNAEATDARALSGFVMAPFIGRISHGKFAFDGKNFTLPANMPPEPHAIHGHAWQTPWEVERVGEHSVSLINRHDGKTGWPWPYLTTQTFTAAENILTVDLTLTNKGEHAMPAGIGWHPYFSSRDARLHADVIAVWQSAEAGIIGDRSESLDDRTDLRDARKVDTLRLDHCFTNGRGPVQINWSDRGLALKMMSSENLGHLTVFTPAGEPFFCVEPVSHVPDAVNNELPEKETGLKILAPDETLNAQIRLSVQASDS